MLLEKYSVYIFPTYVITLNITTRTSETGRNNQKLKLFGRSCTSLTSPLPFLLFPSLTVSFSSTASRCSAFSGWKVSRYRSTNRKQTAWANLSSRTEKPIKPCHTTAPDTFGARARTHCNTITVFICILKHTKRFKKLVELLPNGYSFWILPHVVMDHCLIVVEDTVLHIIQTINIFHSCMHLQATIHYQ